MLSANERSCLTTKSIPSTVSSGNLSPSISGVSRSSTPSRLSFKSVLSSLGPASISTGNSPDSKY